MSYEIRPLSGQILIRINNEAEEKTKSGIIIARSGEKWQKDNLLAEIMAVAEDEKVLKAGQVGIIRGYEGKWLDPAFFDNNTEYLYRVIERDSLLALVKVNVEAPKVEDDESIVSFTPKVN